MSKTAIKKARLTIHEEHHIDKYVKVDLSKSDDNVLFNNNTDDKLREIVDIVKLCSYEKVQPVIVQGETGNGFYAVETWELSVTVHMPPAQGEEEGDVMDWSVNEIKDGSAFGELALIYGSLRAATIAATEVRTEREKESVYILCGRRFDDLYHIMHTLTKSNGTKLNSELDLQDCKLWWIERIRRNLHKEKVEFLPRVNIGRRSFDEIFDKSKIDTMAQLLNRCTSAKAMPFCARGRR
ncbi:hypothetical protein ACHAWF_002579, partial [Thalassiosira exigua]